MPLDPFCDAENCFFQTAFRMMLEKARRELTGTMKMIKNSGWEIAFSHRLFFHFPRMPEHPVGGGMPPSPWGDG